MFAIQASGVERESFVNSEFSILKLAVYFPDRLQDIVRNGISD